VTRYSTLQKGTSAPAADFIENVRAGLRLSVGGRAQPDDFHSSGMQFSLGLAAVMTTLALADKVSAGAGAEFWIWGLVSQLSWMFIWLVLAALPLAFGATATETLMLLIVALHASLLPAGIRLALAVIPEAADVQPELWLAVSASWLLLLWCAMVHYRAQGIACSARRRTRAAFSFLYGTGLALGSFVLPLEAMFYPVAAADSAIDVERTYYQQNLLVDQQLATLAPQDATRPDLYFLAVAPFAAEDVFMREAQQSRALVEQTLSLGERSMLLINHRETVDSLPLANLPNLRRALGGLGEHIDRDQDVVFMFLTSHGDENATLAADLEGIQPNDLHAYEIRAALDEARILWRVVVVSACYSGSFAEQLASPTTLLITAARADRTSFGCDHDNEWTYFGEAFFSAALRPDRDLIGAARRAQALIAEREALEGKEQSQPQLIIGAHIAAQLQRWQSAQ